MSVRAGFLRWIFGILTALQGFEAFEGDLKLVRAAEASRIAIDCDIEQRNHGHGCKFKCLMLESMLVEYYWTLDLNVLS